MTVDPKEFQARALATDIGLDPDRLIVIGEGAFMKVWQVAYFAQKEIWPARLFHAGHWAETMLTQCSHDWTATTASEVAGILEKVSRHWSKSKESRRESERADAARFHWLANCGTWPFSKAFSPWGDANALRSAIDEAMERDRADALDAALATPAPQVLPLSEWHEDYGAAIWWSFPVQEPPYVGSPLDTNWPGYHTHWSPIVTPKAPGK